MTVKAKNLPLGAVMLDLDGTALTEEEDRKSVV